MPVRNTQSIKEKLKTICSEYKGIYLLWLYAPYLLPKKFKSFDELKEHYKMFPKITEEAAKIWLTEEPVQIALKELLKSQHNQKMVELYNKYYTLALEGDTQAFRCFIDFSKTFFGNGEESELQAILKNVQFADEE